MTPQPMSPELMLAATRGPDPDAFQTARMKALTLGNAMQQQQLGQQQLQTGQMQLQQMRRDMADQDTIRQIYSANNGDLDKTYLGAAQAGVSPKALINLQNSNLEQKKNYAELDEKRLANTITGHDIAGGSLKSYIANTDLGTKQYGWDDWIDEQVKDGHLTPGDAAHFRGPYSDERAGQLALGLNTSTILAKNENEQRNSLAEKQRVDLEAQKNKQENDTRVAQLYGGVTNQPQLDNINRYAGAQPISDGLKAILPQTIDKVPDFISGTVAPKLRADTQEAQTKADLGAFQFNLMKDATATGVANAVDSMSIFKGHPDEAQDAKTTGANVLRATGKPDEALKAVNEIAAKLREFTPAVVAGKANEAAATARAVSPVQEAQESYRNALQQGDTASSKYFESLTDQKKALATAQTIQKVIDLSRDGSALAGQQLRAMVPQFTNAMQDIKARGNNNPNMTNAWQHGWGAIKGMVDGVPLDSETINSIAPFVQTVANGATALHNSTVNAINQTYPKPPGQQFAQEPIPYRTPGAPAPVPPAVQSALANQGPGIHKLSDGSTWMKGRDGTITPQ